MDAVDQLASVAAQLVARVRDDDPNANGRWLRAMLVDPEDWLRLAFVLAAAVPDNKTWRELTAWTRPPEREPAACGTPSGARRHRKAGEPTCEVCRAAERERGRRRRAAARAATSPTPAERTAA